MSDRNIFRLVFASILAFFAPINFLMEMLVGFIVVDFFTGIWASYERARRAGEKDDWKFESEKMWDTIKKIVLCVIGIIGCHFLDQIILQGFAIKIKLIYFFTAFLCSTELLSFLENAADISNWWVLRRLRSNLGKKIKDGTGIDIPMKKRKAE